MSSFLFKYLLGLPCLKVDLAVLFKVGFESIIVPQLLSICEAVYLSFKAEYKSGCVIVFCLVYFSWLGYC